MRSLATERLVARDLQTGLYHLAWRMGDAGPFTFEGCETTELRAQRPPIDVSKRLLHGCLFRREEVV